LDFQFKIQDPSNPDTTYILEEIINLIRNENLLKWRGIYSWTTGKTLSRLFIEDEDVKAFASKRKVEFVIGLDAITTDFALIKLNELKTDYTGFESKVFHNDVCDLFHPKISHFEFADGKQILLVGSGNFTLTGLQTNIEAYTITSGTIDEIASISVWNNFLKFHSERIKDIDEETIELAKKNRIRFTKKRKILETEIEIEEVIDGEEVQEEFEEILPSTISSKLTEDSRVLIAQVPAAGGRWKQIHYNSAVIEKFFQAKENSHHRIFLKEIRMDGTTGPDEVRPVVYSTTNKNFKIEVNSPRATSQYPNNGIPIIILREVSVRNFLYMLIMPNDDCYNRLNNFLKDSESVGRGLKRVITDTKVLKNVWPNCPLLY